MNFKPYTLIKPTDLSKMLGVDRHTIVEWAKQGLIPSIKLGKFWRFDPEEVFCYLKENRNLPSIHAKVNQP